MACAAREEPMARWNHNVGLQPVRVGLTRGNRSNGSGNERLRDDLGFVSPAFPGSQLPQVVSTNSCHWAWRNLQPEPRKRRRFALRNPPDTCRGAAALLS